MVNINDTYSGYLKAEDLNNQPINLTISHVEIKKFEDGNKACIFFHGMERGVLLNVTNKNVLVEMFGAETDHWTNQTVCVFPTTTDFAGKIVPCIRLRRPEVGANNAQGPAPQPQQNFQAPADNSHVLPRPQAQQMPEAQHQDYNELNPPPATDYDR